MSFRLEADNTHTWLVVSPDQKLSISSRLFRDVDRISTLFIFFSHSRRTYALTALLATMCNSRSQVHCESGCCWQVGDGMAMWRVMMPAVVVDDDDDDNGDDS